MRPFVTERVTNVLESSGRHFKVTATAYGTLFVGKHLSPRLRVYGSEYIKPNAVKIGARFAEGKTLATHPYISGPGNVEQMIGYLRKNFPQTVSADTVKKLSLAPNNESYVINALQFIGVIDGDAKRTKEGQDVFLLPDDDFSEAFADLIRNSYRDLFALRGEDAWMLGKTELATYFRTSDKTSEAIGSRQAGLFQVFARLSGFESGSRTVSEVPLAIRRTAKAKVGSAKSVKAVKGDIKINTEPSAQVEVPARRDMAMTVRIEINLPANGSKETYDNIFKSIRTNLIHE
jgi:hypothetical protein